MTHRRGTSGVVAALVVARIFYALNWLNIGSTFPLMAKTFGVGVTDLGSITAAFYLGVGLSQVPGGVLAARWGAKKVVLLGISLYSVCAVATGSAPGVLAVSLLRFGVGVGMALIFAPAVVLVANSVKGENSGLGVGVINSAFDIGGILGLVWGVVALGVGWRTSFFISGGLGLATLPLVIVLVPESTGMGFRVSVGGLKRVISDKTLVIIGLGLLSLDCGNTILGGFMVYYLTQRFGLGLGAAGAIASLVVVIPIFFALVGGRAYDRIRRPKMLLLASDLAMAVSLLTCAAAGLAAAVVGVVVGGVATGIGFTVGFAAARDANPSGREYETISVGWVNGISLSGSVFPPLLFSYVTAAFGYSDGWLVGGIATVLIGLPVLLMAEGIPRAASL